MEQKRNRDEELRPLIARFLAVVALAIVAAVALFFAGRADAIEMFGTVGDASWSRCSGSACWDQSGDPRFPLPVEFKTKSQTFTVGARLGEIEVSANYLGAGKVVRGRFVEDRFFDADRRRVVGCPDLVIDAEVSQWTAGGRLVWAPRWSWPWAAASVQPELGAYVHHTRWAIDWKGPTAARGDGGDWSVTPTGGVRLLFDAPARMKVDLALELYHRPTVINAPLGGGQRGGPGLIVGTLGLRY